MLFGKNIAARRYPKQKLEEAWKKLLLNQFHDVITGTSIADVYKDAQKDYQDIRAICADVIGNCFQLLSLPAKKSKSEFHFTLFNSLGWQRNDYVEIFVKSKEKYFSVEDSDGKPVLINL